MDPVWVLQRRHFQHIAYELPSNGQDVIVGKNNSCSIIIQGSQVDEFHAGLKFVNKKWFIKDLQSRHGVFYGGLKIDPAGSEQLHVGSVLGFGTDELFKSDPDLQIFKLVLLPRSKADNMNVVKCNETVMPQEHPLLQIDPVIRLKLSDAKLRTLRGKPASNTSHKSIKRRLSLGPRSTNSSLGSLGPKLSHLNIINKESGDLVKGCKRGSPEEPTGHVQNKHDVSGSKNTTGRVVKKPKKGKKPNRG